MISSDDQGEKVPAEWRFLSDKGLDLTSLETVRQLDRQHLQTEDNGPFYSMLRIAADINAADPADALPFEPANEPPVNLLKQSKQWVGRYIRMQLQTIRLTRVFASLTKRPRARSLATAIGNWIVSAATWATSWSKSITARKTLPCLKTVIRCRSWFVTCLNFCKRKRSHYRNERDQASSG